MDIWTYIPDKGINLLKGNIQGPCNWTRHTARLQKPWVQSLHTEQDISRSGIPVIHFSEKQQSCSTWSHRTFYSSSVLSPPRSAGPSSDPFCTLKGPSTRKLVYFPTVESTSEQQEFRAGGTLGGSRSECLWRWAWSPALKPRQKRTFLVSSKESGSFQRKAQGLGIQMETMRTGQFYGLNRPDNLWKLKPLKVLFRVRVYMLTAWGEKSEFLSILSIILKGSSLHIRNKQWEMAQ